MDTKDPTVDIEPTSKAIVCGIAVGGAIIALLAGSFRALQPNNNGRDLDIRDIDPKTPQALITNFPHGGPGLSPTVQMLANFSAGDGKPILATYHDSYESGCFSRFYQNRNTKGGKKVHHVLSSHVPRKPRTSSTVKITRRVPTREPAVEVSGLIIFTTMKMPQTRLPKASMEILFRSIENLMNGNNEWSQTSIHYFDITDNDDGGARSTVDT
ncbi:hypothetical protein BKA65DRAFT_511679 [Rhexocercosporidium sp. MPI-PUGE-AT-0058]|nr:hypothetical protein BKA65DRAFT_511679 [Rhexocercosporidium sp. MPI-PUGE-AT-0058]